MAELTLSDLIYRLEGEVTSAGDVRHATERVVIADDTGRELTVVGVSGDGETLTLTLTHRPQDYPEATE